MSHNVLWEIKQVRIGMNLIESIHRKTGGEVWLHYVSECNLLKILKRKEHILRMGNLHYSRYDSDYEWKDGLKKNFIMRLPDFLPW